MCCSEREVYASLGPLYDRLGPHDDVRGHEFLEQILGERVRLCEHVAEVGFLTRNYATSVELRLGHRKPQLDRIKDARPLPSVEVGEMT